MITTVTECVARCSRRCVSPHRAADLIEELAIPADPLRGRWPAGIGGEVHEAFQTAVEYQPPASAYHAYGAAVRDWLVANGADVIETEHEFSGVVFGRCDAWVKHGFNDFGIVELKTCDRLPVRYGFREDEHQLGLYAAASGVSPSRLWGALAYLSLTTTTIRMIVWHRMDEHVRVAGRLLKAA